MWVFDFEAPVGARILNSRFSGITHFNNTRKRWFDYRLNKWVDDTTGPASSHANCRSFKAFKRHLRKHPELREAGEIILVSRYVGYSIIANWI